MLSHLKSYLQGKSGNALTETAILFPVMVTMLMGVYDLGQGLIVNQKTVTASQVVGDLIGRVQQTTMAQIQDIMIAGQMSLEPYDTSDYGYDIISIFFDENGIPDILWRVTENMEPNNAAIANADILELTNDGIVIVTTAFAYTPFFTDFVVETIPMQEVAYLKGRRSTTITCSDCPGG